MAKPLGSKKLRAWRKASNISQPQLAKTLGVCAPLISLYESRKLTPSYESAIRLELATDRFVLVEDWGFSPDLRTTLIKLSAVSNAQ